MRGGKMTYEDLDRINRIYKDIQIYQIAIHSAQYNEKSVQVGGLSETERKALFQFLKQRYEVVKAEFVALRVESEEEGQ